jgi:hypothetical protein
MEWVYELIWHPTQTVEGADSPDGLRRTASMGAARRKPSGVSLFF